MTVQILEMSERSPDFSSPGAIPHRRQMQWHEIEKYAIIHFSLNTFTDKEWGFGDEPPALFNPTAFDARQWARVCSESGLNGIILVCKHHDGFCLWPTQTTEHCIRHSPWKDGKGDVVAETASACREYGLKFGVYLSPWDRNHAEYGRPGYVSVYHQQLRELLTGYGPLFEVWFDGANGGDGYYGGTRERRSIDPSIYYQWDKVTALVRELQPDACMFGLEDIRYVGNESGVADETCWATQSFIGHSSAQQSQYPPGTGDRNGNWMPAECDFPLRKGWFFHREDWIRQPATLFELYFQSVGRGGSMNIGLAPDTRGLIHEDDVKALQGWRRLMAQTFSVDLLRTKTVKVTDSNVRDGSLRFSASHVIDGNKDTYWISDDAMRAPELIFEFSESVKFNVISIREHLPLGQRVEAFAVDVWVDDRWSEVGAATSIGNRRLLILKCKEAQKMRLRFTRAAARPAIREVSLFHVPASVMLGGKLSIIRNNEGCVEIRSTNSGLTVHYTVDGSDPDETSLLYNGPFPFCKGGTVKAFGCVAGEKDIKTPVVSATFGMDRSRWKVVSASLDSPFANGGAAGVEKILSDDPDTYWHTYHSDKSKSAPPHEVILDMGDAVNVSAFTFLPCTAEGLKEGTPDKYEFHLSLDGVNWFLAASGEFSNIKASPDMQLVSLREPVAGRYLRFVATHVVDDGNYVVVAGIGVI